MQLFKINKKGVLSELNKLDFIENDAYIIDDNSTIYLWFGNGINKKQKDKAIQKARELNKSRNGSAKLLSMQEDKEYGSFMAMMDDLQKGVKEGDIPRRPEFKLKEKKEEKEKEQKKVKEEIKPEKTEELVEEPAKEEIKPEKTEELVEEAEKKALGVYEWLEQLQTYRKVKEEKLEAPIQKTKNLKETQKESIPSEVTSELQGEAQVQEKEEEPEFNFEEKVKTAAYFVSEQGYTYEELCYILAEKIILEQPFGYASKEQIRKKAEEIFHSSTSYDELCWLIGEMNVLIDTNFYNF
ncbi:MAG: hypothetical protein ACOC44_11940 [Promethearchaeia archaeon]